MPFVSISIDLAGSTELKRRILEISKDDPENTIDLHQHLARRLYLAEVGFYFQAINNGLDLKRFFVVKTIGDELWIIYDTDRIPVSSFEFNAVFRGIIESLMAVVADPSSITLLSRRLTPEEDAEPSLIKEGSVSVDLRHIALKAFVDFVDDYDDLSKIRYDTLMGRFGTLFTPGFDLSKLNLEAQKEIVDRLAIGSGSITADHKLAVSFRTDPFGFKVDHFFRCAKYALPCVVSCGSTLIDQLRLPKRWISEPGVMTENLPLPYGDDTVQRFIYLDGMVEVIPAKDLKGIGADYLQWRIFSHPARPSWEILKASADGGDRNEVFRDTIVLWKRLDRLKMPSDS